MTTDLLTPASMKPISRRNALWSTQDYLRQAIQNGETLDDEGTRELILKCLLPSVVARDQDAFMRTLTEFHGHKEGSGPLRFLEVGFKVPVEGAISPHAWDTIVDALRPGMVQIRLLPESYSPEG